MKHPNPYLLHIIDAIDKIQTFIKGLTFKTFLKDVKTQDAVIRNLEIIGEASTHLEQKFIKQIPQIPWRELKDFRNKLIHDYWELDFKLIWKVAVKRAPQLKKLLEPVVEKLKD
ncbi:DUF86 domain-containing protein [Microgenomates group bacterium]|nr:DUF86 domain-containing protein [Microgenomates group bacterium]